LQSVGLHGLRLGNFTFSVLQQIILDNALVHGLNGLISGLVQI